MAKTALFVKHKAKAGKRDEVQRVWEKYLKPRAQANDAHEAYYFCHEQNDPDGICVFQLFSSEEAAKNFMSGDWYPEYLNEVTDLVAQPPVITSAEPIWIK